MAEVLTIDNLSVAILQRSVTILDAAANDGVVEVQNGDGIPSSSFALIGTMGNEDAELHGINGTSGNTLQFASALVRAHAENTRVTILQADKFRIYRADDVNGTAPDDTAFGTAIDEIDLSPDDVQTRYVDSTGGRSYWYKVTQYNSLTNDETTLADSVAVRGGAVGDYATLDDIRKEAGFADNPNIPNAEVSRYRRRAQSKINTMLAGVYVVPFTTVPDDINEITVLLAAGWLLLKEYGELEEGTNKEGKAKLAEGYEWLKTIVDNANSGIAYLPDVDRIDPSDDGDRISGWPNETTNSTSAYDGGDDGPSFMVGLDY